MENVTGIGGVFIKAKNPKTLARWYKENLGIDFADNTYATFRWINKNNPEVPGSTLVSLFDEQSNYFKPSGSKFMMNFRVRNLHLLLYTLKHSGIWVADKTEYHDHGSFGWIMDPEGNKIELWEPKNETL